MNIVFRRTKKGDEEIQKRTYKLDYIHRFVLIMINGQANVESILSKSSKQWNPNKCLQDLEMQGFIKNIDAGSDSPLSSVATLQQNLISTIQKHLPKNNTKAINKILNSPNNKKSLSDAIDSSCIFIKLTISEDISTKLKKELHEILDHSSEF